MSRSRVSLSALVIACGLSVLTPAQAQESTAAPIKTVAGNGYLSGSGGGGFTGDGGPATQAELFLAGGYPFPNGVVFDKAGDLIFADTGNNRVREVNAKTGDISTVAGGAPCNSQLGTLEDSYCGDGGPATQAGLYEPTGIAVDSAGDIFIADTRNDAIRRVDGKSGTITSIAGSPKCYPFVTITACIGNPGLAGDGGPATSAQFNYPSAIILDKTGNLYIADSLNNRVREINTATGVINTIAGGGQGCTNQTDSRGDGCTATNAILDSPYALALDGTGNLYIADLGNGTATVRIVNAKTQIITVFAGGGNGSCSGATDRAGDGCPATSALIGFPVGLGFDPNGNLFIADSDLQAIRVVDQNGVISLAVGTYQSGYSGTTAGNAELDYPSGVGFDSNGNLYFADTGNNVIREVGYATTAPPSALQFVPVAPCRIVDTRNATGSFGGPEMTATQTREFDIPKSSCNIPSTAVAYSLNVTVVPNSKLGYLTLWPSGQSQPNVSTLNSDGRIKANAAIVPAGSNGGVSIYVTDPTQLILDIDGYFVPAGTSSALAFYPLTPCRIADTRGSSGSLGGPSIGGGSSRAFPILSSKCNIPSTAAAYSLNITAIPHNTLNYLTTWPTGQNQPNVSTLNSSTGAITANAAIVPAGSNGQISVFVSNTSDVILDVNGYFGPPGTGGLSLHTVKPCRVIDTRPNGFYGTKSANVEDSSCPQPSAAQAYVLNSTVVPPGPLLYLSLWPDGEPQPLVSTLNAEDGAITSNMAIVPTNNGSVDAFASAPTNLILDISSYFAP